MKADMRISVKDYRRNKNLKNQPVRAYFLVLFARCFARAVAISQHAWVARQRFPKPQPPLMPSSKVATKEFPCQISARKRQGEGNSVKLEKSPAVAPAWQRVDLPLDNRPATAPQPRKVAELRPNFCEAYRAVPDHPYR